MDTKDFKRCIKKFKNIFEKISNYLTNKPVLRIFLHINIILALSALIILGFFYVFLPIITIHNKFVEVPDFIGLDKIKYEKLAKQKKLKIKIKEQISYNPDFHPSTVLNQNPKPYSKVKPNRSIYVSLNADKPPLTNVPNLINSSLRGAKMILQNSGLKLGKIKYIPDIALNSVLKQFYNNDEIEPNEKIPRGSYIDVEVGAGLGKKIIVVPDITGMDIEKAKRILKSQGIKLGNIINKSIEKNIIDKTENEKKSKEVIISQSPSPGEDVYKGSMVDITLDIKIDNDFDLKNQNNSQSNNLE